MLHANCKILQIIVPEVVLYFSSMWKIHQLLPMLIDMNKQAVVNHAQLSLAIDINVLHAVKKSFPFIRFTNN